MRLKLSRVLADSTDSFEQVGWTLAPQAHRLACLIVIASALCLGLGACILGLVRQFALNSLLITSLTGACACLSMLWVALVFWLYRRTFSPRAVVNVRKLQHLSCAIYDGAGCFYYRSNDPTTEGGEASEWKLGGVKYAPEISNSMVIKVAFLAKCVLKLVSLSLSILRGVHIETGSTSRAWELMMAVVSVNALLLLDDVLALTLGGERSPCALIGKCVYRLVCRRAMRTCRGPAPGSSAEVRKGQSGPISKLARSTIWPGSASEEPDCGVATRRVAPVASESVGPNRAGSFVRPSQRTSSPFSRPPLFDLLQRP